MTTTFRALLFEDALGWLRGGKRIARAGWNGKGMWLVFVPAKAWGAHVEGVNEFRRLPWIGMRTADGGFVPWLASQTDLLAGDWEVLS